jgi:hypothetical protein
MISHLLLFSHFIPSTPLPTITHAIDMSGNKHRPPPNIGGLQYIARVPKFLQAYKDQSTGVIKAGDATIEVATHHPLVPTNSDGDAHSRIASRNDMR